MHAWVAKNINYLCDECFVFSWDGKRFVQMMLDGVGCSHRRGSWVELEVTFFHDPHNDPEEGAPGVLDLGVPNVSVMAKMVKSLTESQASEIQEMGIDRSAVVDPAHEPEVVIHLLQVVQMLQHLEITREIFCFNFKFRWSSNVLWNHFQRFFLNVNLKTIKVFIPPKKSQDQNRCWITTVILLKQLQLAQMKSRLCRLFLKVQWYIHIFVILRIPFEGGNYIWLKVSAMTENLIPQLMIQIKVEESLQGLLPFLRKRKSVIKVTMIAAKKNIALRQKCFWCIFTSSWP